MMSVRLPVNLYGTQEDFVKARSLTQSQNAWVSYQVNSGKQDAPVLWKQLVAAARSRVSAASLSLCKLVPGLSKTTRFSHHGGCFMHPPNRLFRSIVLISAVAPGLLIWPGAVAVSPLEAATLSSLAPPAA